MSKEKKYDNLKFVRLKGSYGEDLIGIVSYKEECIVIEKPLRIEVETIFEEGRQILSFQEYLPQTIVELKEVELSLEDILFVTPVKEEFIEQYEYVRDFFYEKPKAVKERIQQKNDEEIKNVVSILEALANKKDKPIH